MQRIEVVNESVMGAVLAGGQSRRTGRDKATLVFRGQPLIQHVSKLLQGIFEDVIIISGPRHRYEFVGLPTVTDVFPGCGPLGGIHTALQHAGGRAVFVMACDLPYVNRELIEYILAFPLPDYPGRSRPHGFPAAAKVPVQQGTPQPLCGWYSAGCLALIEDALRNRKFRVLAFLKRIETVSVPITPQMAFCSQNLLFNVNTPEDCERMQDEKA